MAKLSLVPTRSELLKLRHRVSLAQRGHDLLKEKMDALVMEFFEVFRKIKKIREVAIRELMDAYSTLSRCFARMGFMETVQASREAERKVQLEVSTRHIMGVPVPVIEAKEIESTALKRGYSIHTTSPTLDEAAKSFENVLRSLIRVAELEASARAMAAELERTRRRVNALEYIVIPDIKSTIRFIAMKLDEGERENFSRLKRISAILEEKSGERG
jgi:V/A-type H+-transporting ATPase subunit D